MSLISFLDGIALLFILAFAVFGFYHGFVDELGKLLGLIVSSVAALNAYVPLTVLVSEWISIDAWVLLIVNFILVFSITLLGMRLLTKILQYLLVSRSSKWANRMLGFVFGGIKGAVMLSIFIWMVDLSPMDNWSGILHSQSSLTKQLTKMRMFVITSFNWDDPVKEGEDFIRNMLEESAPTHE